MAQMKRMSKKEVVATLQSIWEDCFYRKKKKKCDAISYAQGYIKETMK